MAAMMMKKPAQKQQLISQVIERPQQPQNKDYYIQKVQSVADIQEQNSRQLSQQQIINDEFNQQKQMLQQKKSIYSSFMKQHINQQNPQEQSEQYRYSLYNPPQESLQSQQLYEQQLQLQFDPQEYRYPSLHSPESLYVKFDNNQQHLVNKDHAYPVLQQQIPQNAVSMISQHPYRTDQINQFYQQQEQQLNQVNKINQGQITNQASEFANPKIKHEILQEQRSASFIQNSIIVEDYFQKSSQQQKQTEVEIVQPKKLSEADRIRQEMEALNLLMKKKQESIQAVVEEKTTGVKVNPKSIEDTLKIAPTNHVQGANYVIHMVSPQDTLDGISIRYNVRQDVIRKANQFTGDEIFMKRELIIPFTDGPLYKAQANIPVSEEQRRLDLIDKMNFNLKLMYKDQSDYFGEAKFYLQNADYDYERAMADFEEDLKFEKDFDAKLEGGDKGHRVRKTQKFK